MTASATTCPDDNPRALVVLLVVAVHAALFGWALWRSNGPEASSASRTLNVSFVVEPAAVPAQPPQPQRQPAQVPPQLRPPPMTTRNPEAVADVAMPPDPPQKAAPAAAPASPATQSNAAATPVPQVLSQQSGTPEEPAVVPPDFRAAYLANPGPRYPVASRRRREQGVVLLKVRVTAEGSPEQVVIERSSGFADLDNAAASVVKERWKFVPARQGEATVSAWVVVPLEFVLKDR